MKETTNGYAEIEIGHRQMFYIPSLVFFVLLFRLNHIPTADFLAQPRCSASQVVPFVVSQQFKSIEVTRDIV